MDAFYASVEQRDHPEFRGKPLAVGGSRERGVVAAASYEARAFGVRSAMPSRTAYRLCPEILFVKPRFDVYRAVSHQIRAIFYRYTDLVEPLSLDEAYLDVTQNKFDLTSALKIAKNIKAEIKDETELTASAGVAMNKFLAKVASGWHKPDGLTFIPPEQAEHFLEQLPIDRFFGIGKVTAEKMRKWGVETGADLKQKSELELARKFGKAGRHYFRIVRALDNRPVKPDRPRKSLSAEDTFPQDIETEAELLAELAKLARVVASRLEKADLRGYTVTLKIKYFDFVIRTRRKTYPKLISAESELLAAGKELLHRPALPDRPVRLLGLGVSNFEAPPAAPGRQLELDLN